MNLKEIAAAAGVSPATVSLVLNSKPGVNAKTRSRVAMLLQENGYTLREVPLLAAAKRNVIFVRFRGSGHLFEAVDDFFNQVFDGVDRAVKRLSYNLSITNVDRQNLADFLARTTPEVTQGILFLASEFDPRDAHMLLAAKVPFVLIDSRITDLPLNTVTVENQVSVHQALRHLVGLGHRRIGYLSSNELTGAVPERQAAFYHMAERLGVRPRPEDVLSLPIFVDQCYEECLRYFRGRADLPTAFFADNDIIAAGALKALGALRIAVPETVSIVGFDDSLVCKLISPPLTTMRIPKEDLGMLAVQRLQQLIEGDRHVSVSMVIAELIVRGTTAPPRAEAENR